MMKYKDWRPTGFDARGLSLPDRQDWLVAPVMVDRDTADPVALANWDAVQAELGGEEGEETYEIHRFGHWGHGWFEIILVHPALTDKLEEIEGCLEDYPIFDEDLLREKEMEAQNEAWASWISGDLARELREYPSPACTEEDLLSWEDDDIRISDAEDYWDDVPGEEQRELFEQALEDAGGSWECNQEGAYVTRNMAEIAEELIKLLKRHPHKEFNDRQGRLGI